jgi:hypothetical protein
MIHGMKNEPNEENIRNLLLKNAHCSGTRGNSATSDLFTPLEENQWFRELLVLFFSLPDNR